MLSIITGRRPSKNLVVWGGLLAAAFIGAAGCDKVPLLAPSGSTVTLSTNSTIVQANGAAEIRATVLESSGTPVQNGTTVTFSTNLGTVSPSDARTFNGVATAQFIPNGQSGTAKIVATSWWREAGRHVQSVDDHGWKRRSLARVGHCDARPNLSGRELGTITATVSDANGNPLAGVTVAFTTDNGALANAVVATNAGGQASTTLTTAKDATVTATVGGSGGTTPVSSTVKVTVGVLPTLVLEPPLRRTPRPGRTSPFP